MVDELNPLTNTTKLVRKLTWFGSLSVYSIGYKYANQTLFTFLPLILLLVFNTLLVRQVSLMILDYGNNGFPQISFPFQCVYVSLSVQFRFDA